MPARGGSTIIKFGLSDPIGQPWQNFYYFFFFFYLFSLCLHIARHYQLIEIDREIFTSRFRGFNPMTSLHFGREEFV